MKELITQIENHLAVCAPHIKEREQCQLLIKALERLKFLKEESEFLHTGIGQIKNHKSELKLIIMHTSIDLHNKLITLNKNAVPVIKTLIANLKRRMRESKQF